MATEKPTPAEDPRAGSTPRTDPEPHLVDQSGSPAPVTAGQLRAAGYGVPDDVKDDDVPGAYAADSPHTDAEPHLVQDLTPPELILTDKTAAEHAATQPKATGGPATPATTLAKTPAQEAVANSKGSAAEKKGPKPKAETLSNTPAQAAGGEATA